MKILKLGLHRLEASELDQVAALQELGQALLLVPREQVRALQFIKKFLGRAFRRAEIETFLKIPPDGIRNEDAELARLMDQIQSGLELLPGADMGGDRRDNSKLRAALLPITPGQEKQRSDCQRR